MSLIYMDGDMRKIIRIVTVFFVILVIFSTEYHFNCIVNAKDQNLSGTPMQLEQRMSSYKEKSTDSDLINTFEKGDYVLVLSEDDEWLTIFFRGEIAFIPVMGEQLKENIVSNEVLLNEVDQTGFDIEQEKLREEDADYINALLFQKQKEKRIFIWRSMIFIVLAMVIAYTIRTLIGKKQLEGDT